MSDTRYHDIVTALEEGRRALARARLTAGLVRLAGIGVSVLTVLVLWAALQRTLHLWSVPAAAMASLLGAGVLVFTLARWVVLPLVRMPDREDFVRLVERRFPLEKNLIVNAFQLGDDRRETQGGRAPDLVDAVVARAAERIHGLDLRRWRDPAPDRPYLWAAGAGLGSMAILAVLTPSLFFGALTQVLRPSEAGAPPVSLAVSPGNTEVDRGSDLSVQVEVGGTDRAPTLYFRERSGAWRALACAPVGGESGKQDAATWAGLLLRVDRPLEYRVTALRSESPVYTVQVRETPRLAGFRTHVRPPAYTRLAPETVTGGTGDVAALLGSAIDLRVLVNRPVAGARLEWQADRAAAPDTVALIAVDPTTWKAEFPMREPASYSVVLTDEQGAERVRSPRYRVEPIPDRPPFLTLHFPLEDHDLASDMMERVVADAADDFGFSTVFISYRVDDGPEVRVPYTPFQPGQKEFRLDTLWDLTGLDLLPGSAVAYYVEVRDNDAVSGPKAVRSPVRRVRFPTVSEIYQDVAEEHGKEIEGLSDVKESQREIRERLEKLDQDLKRGHDVNWEVRQDVEKALDQQNDLEQQLSDMVRRLGETVDKASGQAQMNQELVQKMDELNMILNSLGDEDMKRAFRELSRALEQMDRNALRQALEKVQLSQDEMLRGMDRTMELLKQIRREEQMEDVVQRTDEIAALQEAIARELEKLTEKERAKASERGEDKNPEAGNQEQQTGAEEKQQADQDTQAGDEQRKAGEKQEAGDDEQKSAEDQAEQAEKPSDSSAQDADKQSEAGEKQGDKQKSTETPSSSSSPKGEDQEKAGSSQADLSQLAKKQEDAQKLLEELKRLLRQLQKLNEENEMAQDLAELEKDKSMGDLSKSMQGAQQGMAAGKPKEASPFAFQAREEAKRLADMARSMQQEMKAQEEETATETLGHVIEGLIDVSRVEEELATAPEDSRGLAERQLALTEAGGAVADSLLEVMKKSFLLDSPQLEKLHSALNRMGRAMRGFEEGSDQMARHEATESVSDLNETIVELMRSQQQMCSSSGMGSLSQKMQGLSQGQQDLNSSTRQMLEKMAKAGRLSHSDDERLAQMAAQQEMIRKGLEEAQQQFSEAKDLLGDMEKLAKDMDEAQKSLQDRQVDRRLQERQEKILSRLLDAQRSVRQREMSPERQSRTGTLASRPSPPPIPASMLERERTLAEDVLRGASDRYPSQFRKLVEEYFRALSRENPAP